MTAPLVKSTSPFPEYAPPPGVIDARPILTRSTSNVWERTEQLRSRLRNQLEEECRARKIEALVIESQPYVHPAWVKFESWIPAGDQTLTRRSSMTVTITAMPYHQFEAIYKVEWTWEGASGSVDQLHTFGDSEMRSVLNDITSSREPSVLRNANSALSRRLRSLQLRQHGWQLLRPRNKITTIRPDYAKTTSAVVALLGAYLAWSVGTVQLDQGASTVGKVVLDVLILAVVVAVVTWIRISRTGRMVRSPGKPIAEPRNLRYLDSWQTVVFGAGRDADELRTRLMTSLSSAQLPRFACAKERIWYWGLEGKEEREQMILRYGRALVFAQVYQYGPDLYVGWDAQLNIGVWMEKQLAAGVERSSGKRVDLKTVEHGWQVPSEYDVIDVNCLAEWTHAQVSQVIRHYVKERKIDQEIDFTIIRGERKGIKDEPEQKKRNPFKRTA